MGSPFSPALCGRVIAAQEEIWRRTFSITCSSMYRALLSLRYVDNRIWISERRFEQLPGVRLLLNNRFYGGDIALEDEPAYDFVGFSLDFEQRRIMYNRACQTSDLPSTKSAAPEHVLLSGVLALAHTIKKCSYPRAQALMDLRREITRALLEVLRADAAASDEEHSASHSASLSSALHDETFRNMLADFVEKTTQEVNDLQQRVRELENSVAR
ncbi:unnamed protein product [Symbiodinium sp. CCMP2456]|nr:unnamed protein product [Symbiodinium sp. CCMP2456]